MVGDLFGGDAGASRHRAPAGDERARGPACILRVALPVPEDRCFDYLAPATDGHAFAPGQRVVVPFGTRRTTGVIVDVLDRAHPDARGKLRSIERVVDPEPVISGDLLAAIEEEAAAVLCPIGVALQTALPAGSTPRAVEALEPTPRGQEALARRAVSGEARTLLEWLGQSRPTPGAVARRNPRWSGLLRHLERDGLVRRRQQERAPVARAARVRVAGLAPGVDVADALTHALGRAPRQAELLARLAHGDVSLPTLREEFGRAAELLRSLEGRGLVRTYWRAAPRRVLTGEPERQPPLELSDEQRRALEPIGRAIREDRHEPFLLHGVTGSGKTEVYLRAVAESLARGRQALVLVPEISLTHQIVARLRGRFGDRLAVLHSGLRPGERLEQWEQLRKGRTPIAVGARSAVFAPLERLGLIVIDEEHDGAYKNEEGFRYHARTLAAARAERAGCPLVLGSATPDVEVRYGAERGAYTRLALARRIGSRPLPSVEIVDLARERSEDRGPKRVLSRTLRTAMRHTLDAGDQSILFLNRRGFASRVLCFECGHAERCRHCDIALVFHAGVRRLRCHYCDYQVEPPERCTGCGAPDTALLGIGTERLEEEVRGEFPDARIARLDRDTAARRGATAAILADLAARRIDVLIGTQMVAKGHDYPGVRLVGVVAADVGLHLPDFRAAERTFQLLTQVAGRAGRGSVPGRVVIQTFVPDHYAIAPVRRHDVDAFHREELAHRKALGYPPFGRLAHVLVSGENESEVARAAGVLADAARRAGDGDGDEDRLEVLGPAPAPLARLRDRYRHQLLLKTASDAVLRRGAEAVVETIRALPRAVQAHVDVRPMHML